MAVYSSYNGDEFCQKLREAGNAALTQGGTSKGARYLVYTWLARSYRARTGQKAAKLTWPLEVYSKHFFYYISNMILCIKYGMTGTIDIEFKCR